MIIATIKNMVKVKANLNLLSSFAAIMISLILIAIKFFAWTKTGYVSIQATLIDSILDALSSSINFVMIYTANIPADHDHRFGHGKAESLGALFQTLLTIVTGLWLFYEGYQHIRNPQQMAITTMPIVIMGVSVFLTTFLVLFQRYVISKTSSMAIKADLVHYKGDLLINISVILSIVVCAYTKIVIIDAVLGIIIGAYIVYGAYRVSRDAIDVLMDKELPDTQIVLIKKALADNADILGYHDLRTRSASNKSFVQLHIELDSDLSLKEAHKIADKVEMDIEKAIPNCEVITHQDPICVRDNSCDLK